MDGAGDARVSRAEQGISAKRLCRHGSGAKEEVGRRSAGVCRYDAQVRELPSVPAEVTRGEVKVYGSVTRISAPHGDSSPTAMAPPWASMIRCAMAIPRPVPVGLVV